MNFRFIHYRKDLGWVGIVFVIALGAILRVYHLGFGGLWLDEIAQMRVAEAPISGFLPGIASHNGAAPLDYLIARIMRTISSADEWLKFPAVIWGLASILVLYLLGSRLYNRHTALLSALLLAVSPIHIRYSQELRFYSLFFFCSLLSTYLLLHAAEARTSRGWLYYATALVASFYSHYFTFFLLLFHGLLLFFVLRENDRPPRSVLKLFLPWLGAAAVAGILFAPWILFDLALFGLSSGPFDIPLPPYLEAFAHIPSFITSAMARPFQTDPAAVLVFGTLFAAGILQSVWNVQKPFAIFATLTLLIGPGLILGLNQATDYFYHPRQLLFIFPYFLLVTASGAQAVFNVFRTEAARLSFLLFIPLVALLLGIPNLNRYYAWEEEPWERMANFLALNNPSELPILVPRKQDIFAYYVPALDVQPSVENSLQGIEAFLDEQPVSFIVVTGYMDSLPDVEAILERIRSTPHLTFQFSPKFQVVFIDQNRSQDALNAGVFEFTLPVRVLADSDLIQAMIDSGRISEALAGLETVMAQPVLSANVEDLAELHFLAGTAQLAQGANRAAAAAFERALALDPTHEGAMVNLARTYIAEQRYPAAGALLEPGITRYPESAWLQYFLGRAYFGQGNDTKAIAAYEVALQIQPENPTFLAFLGQAQCRSGLIHEALYSLILAQRPSPHSEISALAAGWKQKIMSGAGCP